VTDDDSTTPLTFAKFKLGLVKYMSVRAVTGPPLSRWLLGRRNGENQERNGGFVSIKGLWQTMTGNMCVPLRRKAPWNDPDTTVLADGSEGRSFSTELGIY
jgi:hypothetical protein